MLYVEEKFDDSTKIKSANKAKDLVLCPKGIVIALSVRQLLPEQRCRVCGMKYGTLRVDFA